MRLESYVAVDRALKDVLAALSAPRQEKIPATRAGGRILVDSVIAEVDSPRFPVSHMDGFAVHAADTAKNARVKVVGEVNPETTSVAKVARGEAVRVSTGSRLPEGTDAVVPVEQAKESGGWISTAEGVEEGAHVFQAGSDFRKGEVLIHGGSRLRAQDIALLLSLGRHEVQVFSAPKVAIIATGNELYDIGNASVGKSLNTHGPMFASLVETLGCVPLDMGVTPDDTEVLSEKLRKALEEADLVLTLGGTSVGRRDVTAAVIREMKPRVFHHGLKMDRGRVTGVAVVDGRPVVMLPGPIQGAMNAFLLFASPIIDRLRGGGGERTTITAKLTLPWKARRRFRDFTKVVYVRLEGKGKSRAVPILGETESITVLTSSTGYVIVPERTTQLRRGASVDVFPFPE